MTTVGEALITLLEAYGVDTVFGIPGVHTIELYRGLARSKIRHVTPRHEQGAAFMADGYARVSGKPGVALVITGPGLTNAITAMAQARADSVPMLVISGVNAAATLGKGLGYLHELPDQRGMLGTVALSSQRVADAGRAAGALARAFAIFATSRPGPGAYRDPARRDGQGGRRACRCAALALVCPRPAPSRSPRRCASLRRRSRPLILAGGGAKRAETALRELAEKLGAPVVLTANARGLLHAHPLGVPASPSLKPVRALIDDADLVIAVGTEFGPTDYDMYADGGFAMPKNLIRIDIDADQLARRPATLSIQADCGAALAAIAAALASSGRNDGAARAETTRKAALAELTPDMRESARRDRDDPRHAARRHHRRRFDAAGLCRQPLLRPRPSRRLVQCGDRLRRARLRPAGGDRRGACRA